MEIVYHLGVHFTDEDRLPRALLKSREALAAEGIVIPWPRHYRYLFRDLLVRLEGMRASAEIQTLILDACIRQDAPRRVVFSHADFLGNPSQALGGGMLYPGGAARVQALRNLFPESPVAFRLSLRNPATFLPQLFEASGEGDFDAFLAGGDPERLRWSDLIARIGAAVPDCGVTVWCNEDTPLIWPEVVRTVAGSAPATPLAGVDEFLPTLLTEEGLRRMQAYLAEHPPASEARRRRVIDAFLEKFARPDRLAVEIDLPGWSQDYIDRLTEAYDADIGRIASLPGVTVVT
jgi:hypothetical protein